MQLTLLPRECVIARGSVAEKQQFARPASDKRHYTLQNSPSLALARGERESGRARSSCILFYFSGATQKSRWPVHRKGMWRQESEQTQMSAGNSSTKRRPALLQQQQFYAQMRLGDRGGQLSLLLRRGTINNDDNYAWDSLSLLRAALSGCRWWKRP